MDEIRSFTFNVDKKNSLVAEIDVRLAPNLRCFVDSFYLGFFEFDDLFANLNVLN